MTVSVVVPTYQRCRLLMDRAIPSILAQTYLDWECHVVGDGTDPQTAWEMGELVARDSRFRFTNLPHQVYPDDLGAKWCVLGLEALNYGLDTATGDWVAVLADDDEWEPDAVGTLLGAAQTEGVDFAYGMCRYHWPDEHPQTAGAWPPGFGQLSDSSYVRKRDHWRYDPACIERGLPEDGDLWTRMYAAGVTFTFVPRVVVHYYPNPR